MAVPLQRRFSRPPFVVFFLYSAFCVLFFDEALCICSLERHL